MKLSMAVQEILEGKKIQNKLVNLKNVKVDKINYKIPIIPGRESKLNFSNTQKKFPKNFERKEARAFALHSFANHELLAIEIMASAIARFQQMPNSEKFIQGILSALKDEQRHLEMYIRRINELGYEFGDFPLNDYFWKYADKLITPEKYLSLISLTFESANLDFSFYYATKFLEIEDEVSSKIMMEIYQDEISHVKFGEYYMNQWKNDESLWEYYCKNLIDPISPARAKGLKFDINRRLLIGLDADFQKNLFQFEDNFRITKRKCNTTLIPPKFQE